MQLRFEKDFVEVSGYVNAIERASKPLLDRAGYFVEHVCKGAFKRAIERNNDIHILLNHDWEKDLGSTLQGNLELEEDNIGLKARATIKDREVIEKAKNGDLIGWSFGFTDEEVEEKDVDGVKNRAIKDLNLYEVSVLDRKRIPAYDGNLLYVRNKDKKNIYISEIFIEKKQKEIDYSKYENLIAQMKGDIL